MSRTEIAIGSIVTVLLVLGSWLHWLPYEMTETLGFVTGAWCVYLVVKQNIWTFPIGIANNVFFLVLFGEAKLYGDAGLQVVYMMLALHGWYSWLYGGENRTELHVSNASATHLGVVALFVGVATYGLMELLHHMKGAAPLLDSFTTVLSLAAQYMLNRKFIENWYVWILADVIYIYLYLIRGLELTAVLYFVFLCMCIAGVVAWRRAMQPAVEAAG